MKPGPAQKHLFYSEMAKLLEAGFGIREAGEVMTGSGLPAAQADLIHNLNRGLASGKSITDALAGDAGQISPLERCIIGAGERGGRLPSSMRHLADYFGMLASSRREALKALLHPIITLHLAVFIGIVPTAMIAENQSKGQIAASFFMTLLAAYGGLFLLVIAVRALLSAARHHAGADRFLHRIPLLGKTRNALAMAGFCKVYHTCLLAGIPMRETVRMASDASQSGMILAAAKHLEETLAAGNPLGPALASESVFPKAFSRSYATGESAGTLDKDLANWAGVFQEDSKSGIRTLAAVIPKALYLIMIAYAAWKITGFYDAYYGRIMDSPEP